MASKAPTVRMPDAVLVRVARGDRDAMNECMRRYGPLVWSLARRHSPSQAEAEDAVQDVFLDLWRGAARFDATIASEPTFIAMITRRRLIDRRRRRQTSPPPTTLSEAVPLAATGQSAEVSAEAQIAARALEKLRPEQREAIVLSTCHDMTHDEIAAKTGMPLGTVKAHVRRGLICIRTALLGVEEEPAT
jgi:RNA polymerase sigma-70 factor (ECF subfamily)